MSEERKIDAMVLNILGGIAPEADLTNLASDANFRRELDLDSVDFQTFIIRLSKESGVVIPDRDAGRLVSLAGCREYLARLA